MNGLSLNDAVLKNTLTNFMDIFATPEQARAHVAEVGWRHYEIWFNGQLVEFGQTPTRIRRTGNNK